ncbi:MAG: FAD-dependent oxidoreductase [Chloroflexi bacterium]|nr:FAD-dependent oxidoreductase [Chloroflexota bacterium]
MADQPTVELPAERVPVIARCDLLVVGGGAAGLSAAIAARRQGADVILVERYGYLGGLASGGLIVLLLTMDDGAGRQVVAGLCQELVERLEARDACFYPPSAEWGDPNDELVERYRRWGLVWGSAPHKVRYSVAYDPEEFKLVANNWVAEAGVRLLYHRWASDLVRDGDRVTHVVFTSKAGRQAIACDAVVDTTGDGDLFALADEPFELEQVHPWLWFRMSGVDENEAGGSGSFRTIRPGQALLPWGAAERIGRRIDATDPDDLTFAEVECRRMVMEEVDRLRSQVRGFENAYLTDVALTPDVTESRRLTGRYVLQRDDLDKPFDDVVAVTGHWTKYDCTYQIPYRSLLPQQTENLLAAGRCISVDHRAHHATKEIPACFATGEAAGVAAALSMSRSVALADLDVGELQRALVKAGAWLPERGGSAAPGDRR